MSQANSGDTHIGSEDRVTPITPYQYRTLMVSLSRTSGHADDMREYLGNALSNRGIEYYVFQHIEKGPESSYDVTVKMIVLCKGAILDVSLALDTISCPDPEILIQFGMCFALGKEVVLVAIDPSTHNEQKAAATLDYPEIIASHVYHFPSFRSLAQNLDVRTIEWHEQVANRKQRQSLYEPRNILSFSVLGASEDEREAIKDFVGGTRWRAKYDPEIEPAFRIQSLARQIGSRSFCIFCLNHADAPTLVAVGLAMGMGVPFIIVHKSEFELPPTLQGYHATIEYKQYQELKSKLKKYASRFLKPEIAIWEDATFRRLTSQADHMIHMAQTETALIEPKALLEAVIAAAARPIPEPYAGLGNLFLARFYLSGAQNLDLLHAAKNSYEYGLRFGPDFIPCQSGIVFVEKNIELLELLQNGNYKSISSLIHLIGDDLNSEQYERMRLLFLAIIRELVENQDYINALALLSAMRLHDESGEIDRIIQSILDIAPNAFQDAYFDAQNDIAELKKQVSTLEVNLAQSIELLEQTRLQATHLQNLNAEGIEREIKLRQANETLQTENAKLKMQLGHLADENGWLQQDLKSLENKLRSINGQLVVIEANNAELRRAEGALSVRENLERTSPVGLAVLVNFGVGWGMYVSLAGTPYISRDDQWLSAEPGLVLQYGDRVHYDGGSIEVRLQGNYW